MTWRTEKLAQDIRGLTIASLVFSCLNLPLVVFTCFVNIYWLAGRVPERDPWRSRSSGHDLTLRRLLVASVAICTSYSIICAFVTIGNIAWCSLVLDKRRRFATRQLWLKRYLVFATPMIVAMAVFCIVSGAVVVTYYNAALSALFTGVSAGVQLIVWGMSLAIYRYQRALDRPASDVELTRTKDAPSQSSINKEDVTV